MLKPLPIDRSAADARFSVITFIAHVGFDTQELAHMLDSLVRVSRRVEWNHLVNTAMLGRCPVSEIHEGRKRRDRKRSEATQPHIKEPVWW